MYEVQQLPYFRRVLALFRRMDTANDATDQGMQIF
jgi:hypothetical protein